MLCSFDIATLGQRQIDHHCAGAHCMQSFVWDQHWCRRVRASSRRNDNICIDDMWSNERHLLVERGIGVDLHKTHSRIVEQRRLVSLCAQHDNVRHRRMCFERLVQRGATSDAKAENNDARRRRSTLRNRVTERQSTSELAHARQQIARIVDGQDELIDRHHLDAGASPDLDVIAVSLQHVQRTNHSLHTAQRLRFHSLTRHCSTLRTHHSVHTGEQLPKRVN